MTVPLQVIVGSPLEPTMWGPAPGMSKVIVCGPAPQLVFAKLIASRSEPAPESLVLVTVVAPAPVMVTAFEKKLVLPGPSITTAVIVSPGFAARGKVTPGSVALQL